MPRPSLRLLACALLAWALAACADAAEAPRLSLPVVAGAWDAEAAVTAQGYTVTVHEARAAIGDLGFLVAGELHAHSPLKGLLALIAPPAHAHPGHYQGGDLLGELPGRFLVDWLGAPGAPLGEATLLPGRYHAADFALLRAEAADGLAPGDPLLGHTALLRGTARRGEAQVAFTVVLDAPLGRQLTGAPFAATVTAATRARLALHLAVVDPQEGDTLFDGVDFLALDGDGDGQVTLDADSPEPAASAYLAVRRAFMSHDHFFVRLEPLP